MQKKEKAKGIAIVDSHNDWMFIKEVMACRDQLKESSISCTHKDIASFFDGKLESTGVTRAIEYSSKMQRLSAGSSSTVLVYLATSTRSLDVVR